MEQSEIHQGFIKTHFKLLNKWSFNRQFQPDSKHNTENNKAQKSTRVSLNSIDLVLNLTDNYALSSLELLTTQDIE